MVFSVFSKSQSALLCHAMPCRREETKWVEISPGRHPVIQPTQLGVRHQKLDITWLVVSNMFFSHILGIILPTDFHIFIWDVILPIDVHSMIFQRGRSTTNQSCASCNNYLINYLI